MKTRFLILSSLFTALIAVGAFVRIPTPLVPITLQVFFVILSGLLLPPKIAAVPPAVYAALGLFGVPIFTKGGGFAYVFEPSFGFILGFILLSFLVSLLVRNALIRLRNEKSAALKAALCVKAAIYSLLCLAALYAVGVTYMYLINRFYLGTDIAFWLLLKFSTGYYLLFDIGKFAVAILLGVAVMARLPRQMLVYQNKPESKTKPSVGKS